MGGYRDVLGCLPSQGGCRGVHDSLRPCVPAVPTKWGLVLERLIVLGWTFSDMLTRTQVFVGRLLELHILKLVALYTVWVALEEVPVLGLGQGAQPAAQSADMVGTSSGVSDELLAGAAVGLCHALLPLPPHGLLPLHHLDLHHHRLQDALPAQDRQPQRLLQQLHPGAPC